MCTHQHIFLPQHFYRAVAKQNTGFRSYLISGVVISAASESDPSLLVSGNKPGTETCAVSAGSADQDQLSSCQSETGPQVGRNIIHLFKYQGVLAPVSMFLDQFYGHADGDDLRSYFFLEKTAKGL